MNSTQEHKLDNPVWYSCLETHKEFAIGLEGFQGYHPNYCSFGGFDELAKTKQALDDYAKLSETFFVVGLRPHFSENLVLKNELVCEQMILHNPIDIEIVEEVVQLNLEHHNSLIQLVNLVQPGYFMKDTPHLGDYYGIFKNKELVAVTGERMKMNQFTEISAVITHPNHSGKGYAKQLVSQVANRIFSQNKIPYLHVATSNTAAIKLYEKLGFTQRRKISFWNFSRK